MLEAIMRKNDARNFGGVTIGNANGKLPADFVAKIGAEERP